MCRLKSDYWKMFEKYKQFQTVGELEATINRFLSKYHLTKKEYAVLMVLLRHAKNVKRGVLGVTWMRRKVIAKKSNACDKTVDRVIKILIEYGLLEKHQQTNEMRGGDAPNVLAFVNPNAVDNSNFVDANVQPNVQAVEVEEQPSNPTPARDSEVTENPYNRLYNKKDFNKKEKDIIDNINDESCSSLKINEKVKETNPVRWVPKWFQEIFKPYYGESPQIVADYWKTACVSAKQVLYCGSIKKVPQSLVQRVWKNVVKKHKQNKIENGATTDAVRAYFYGAMLDDIDFLFKPSLQ